MRIEGGDDRWPPLMRRPRHRAPDDRLVAEVKAIEIAKGHDTAPEAVRDAVGQKEALHLGRLCREDWAAPLVRC